MICDIFKRHFLSSSFTCCSLLLFDVLHFIVGITRVAICDESWGSCAVNSIEARSKAARNLGRDPVGSPPTDRVLLMALVD